MSPLKLKSLQRNGANVVPGPSMPPQKQHAAAMAIIFWLVVSAPLKNMKVSWDDYSQYMGK